MKWQAKVVPVLLSIVAMITGAQSSTEDRSSAQETQARGYWVDPSSGLMWAGKDSGKDVYWYQAKKYCRNLRLAGYTDWRLATIDELQGIFDWSASAPGLNPKSRWHEAEAMNFHVKGNLYLTGDSWSSSQRIDDRGHPSAWVWYFDFLNGFRESDPTGFPNFYSMRALCVRGSGQ